MKKPIIFIVAVLALLLIVLSASVFMNGNGADVTRAYQEKRVFEMAIEKVNADAELTKSIGKIQPIDQMTILNGESQFNGNHLKSTIKVISENATAKLDLQATQSGENWTIDSLQVRVPKTRQTFKIIP